MDRVGSGTQIQEFGGRILWIGGGGFFGGAPTPDSYRDPGQQWPSLRAKCMGRVGFCDSDTVPFIMARHCGFSTWQRRATGLLVLGMSGYCPETRRPNIVTPEKEVARYAISSRKFSFWKVPKGRNGKRYLCGNKQV